MTLQTVPDLQHRTVLLDEAVDGLAIEGERANGIYLDGTFGRGGHSRKILARLGAGGAGRAEASAGARYLAGSTDYSTVIVAQTAAYAARQNPIQSVVDQQMATVALIQAIGGQWPKAGTPEPAAM